jgi:hypothetical protein
MSRESDTPAFEMPSSPPSRLVVSRGRSVQGMTWLCIWLTRPKLLRIFPTFISSPAGSVGNVMKPSSISAPSGEKARKKSARAYGSTTAWNVVSTSSRSSEGGASGESLWPAAPRKFPMTAMSGLKTLAPLGGAAPAVRAGGSVGAGTSGGGGAGASAAGACGGSAAGDAAGVKAPRRASRSASRRS